MIGTSYMGVEVGSTSVKAAIYTLDGRVLGAAGLPNRTLRSRPGRSEQDMEEVWATTVAAMRAAVARAGDVDIAGIGLSGQGDGLWALDADLRPVRDAILWNDARADDLVLDWIADGTSAALSRFSRTANWAGTVGTLLRWVSLHEPDVAARIAHVLYCKDWIGLRLTGVLSTDYSDATIPFLDIERRVYDRTALELLGVGSFFDALPPPARSIDVKGGLTI